MSAFQNMNPFGLLWAEAVDTGDGVARTAMVIQCGGQLLGGIARLDSLDVTWGPWGWREATIMNFKMFFEWFEVCDSAEAFRRSKRWREARGKMIAKAEAGAHAPALPKPPLMIEHQKEEE